LVESTTALAESTTAAAESTVAAAESTVAAAESIVAVAVVSSAGVEEPPPQEAANTPRAKAKKPIFRAFFIFDYFLGFEILSTLYTRFEKR
jgi:hypothetical protein